MTIKKAVILSTILGVIIYAIYSLSVYYLFSNIEVITITATPSPVSSTEEKDPRVQALESYFEGRKSPLKDHAQTFIETADKEGIDWTILPAISLWESGGGKQTPSCAPHNPFGWTSTTSPCGYYRFASFDDAIRIVGEKISVLPYYSDFRASGRIEDLAQNYNKVRTIQWIEKVNYFREAIEHEI